MYYRLYEILKAPCWFCGYNGAGYFQSYTHSEDCPFYEIGGSEEREQTFVDFAKKHMLRVEKDWCLCANTISTRKVADKHWSCKRCGKRIKRL